MIYSRELKYCLNLPSSGEGCRHWLRNQSNLLFTRGRPESQERRNSERVGFFVLREDWIGDDEEKQKQIANIPRKTARCYGCRTNFILIWEKYALQFDWVPIVDGRHSESFCNTYNVALIEEFKLHDDEFNNKDKEEEAVPPQKRKREDEAVNHSKEDGAVKHPKVAEKRRYSPENVWPNPNLFDDEPEHEYYQGEYVDSD